MPDLDGNAPRDCAGPACDTTFRPKRKDHRFCSPACRKRRWRQEKWEDFRDDLADAITDVVREHFGERL